RLEAESVQTESKVAETQPRLAAAQRHLRALITLPGVADVLFGAGAATIPAPAEPDDEDDIVAVIKQALTGKRPTIRRVLRERYDTCRADLAGLWTLDPGDSHDNLDTFVL